MQNMYKTNPKRKKLLNTTTFAVALFVAAIMISSSIPTIATPGNSTKMKINEEAQSTGLAPRQQVNPTLALENMQAAPQPFADYIYGYNAYDPSGAIEEGCIIFEPDDPGYIELIDQPTGSGNFIAGADWTCDDKWLGVEYGSGVLWEMDPDTGEMTSIGGGGTTCNGFAYDNVNNWAYGAASYDLYGIDYETGEQTYIGPYGGSAGLMIEIACDDEGELFGWDLVTDSLYGIDKESGAATLIGSLGISINYAQSGCFDHDDGDTLYLTAYTSTGQLYTCDKTSGATTLIGGFQGGMEVTGAMIMNVCIPPDHDVGIKAITKPETSGYAVPEVEMQCLVKNYGANAEVTDVQMEVIKCEAGPDILDEHFDGPVFPPENWTTDYWKRSYTNVAGGTSPEARCYKYDYTQTYDNYLQSPTIDCTGVEKVNLKFRWAADVQYNNYCSIYLKYRKNTTSPWKDVTPWDNPLGGDMDADYWEIGCYGFGESLGDEFQFKFEYIGYYYYFNYWWLDDMHLEQCGGCADYAEIVEDVSIASGEELLVDFPGYNPPEWQNESYEDTWEEYPIHAFTLLVDQKPKNNDKWKLIDLYYPYLHDVEVSSIDSPAERNIPGQTLPVTATIKNVGQYPECCIPINMEIGQGNVVGTLLTEDMYYVIPTGWTDEHKNYVYYYGWGLSYSSYSGGSYREARLPYYYALADYVFYTPAIDTTSYPGLKLNFKSYVNHYSGTGLYALEAGYSHDGENWFATWHEEPSSSGQYEVEVNAAGGSATTYIGFWMKGDPWYINYWYLDDVEIQAVELIVEYEDNMCQGPDIEPGESVTFEFDDWTPEALAEEITKTEEYLLKCSIEMEGDKDPGNDVVSGQIALDFWHDAGVEVASPAAGREPEAWLGFHDGTAVNALGLTAGGTFQYAIRLTPDELASWGGYQITSVKRHHGYTSPFNMNGNVIIYEAGTSTTPGAEITRQAFSTYEIDWHEVPLDEPVDISGDEDIWVSIEVTHASGQYPAAMDSALNYAGKGNWIYLSSWVQVSIYGFYCDWLIEAGVEKGGGAPIKVYIQPGVENIEAIATNHGTFNELDLTCWAEIYDFIDDPENGTLLYEDNITNIDLDVPLGGTETLIFDDFNFAREGLYGLFLDMPDEDDDIPKNNAVSWGVYVDDTDPVSEHALDPPTPDGDNGWYVSDVEVTLDAYDPDSGGSMSDVKEIKYKVDGGATQTISGNHGTFIVDTDKDNLPIEYWAVDEVGNEESHNTFTIDMDQTDPVVDMVYEWEVNPDGSGGWLMTFNATASDVTSKMNRVRFLLNGVEQDVVTGPGPLYIWQFVYHGNLKITITAEAYDNAGNMAFDEIINPENININGKAKQKPLQKTIEIQGI
jgi:hypothetical protein